MNFINSTDGLCRICLKDNVFFDWTEAIFEFSGPSYKECYFQYTHLQEEDEDVCAHMICLDCGDGLRNTYMLVEKAIASYKKLMEFKMEEPIMEFKIEQINFPDINDTINENLEQSEQENINDTINENLDQSEQENSSEHSVILNSPLKEELINSNSPQNIVDSQSVNEADCSETSKLLKLDNDGQTEKKKKGLNLMCSHCSKICDSMCKLIDHEKTHDKNRERTEVCPICGLKFYDKTALKIHIPIHDENRERKHKCEFCHKAFFYAGGLNLHKRKHLEQMIKCKLCPKEFYRQGELDRHMQSHDATPITASNQKTREPKTPIFVECKTCGRKINWDSWKTHKAKHLNQPQLQCNICDKTYYRRRSITRHLNQCHGKSTGEYEKFIIKINTIFQPRLSRLMKKQNIIIE